eukprot:759209-Hanusia_phi.AAC.5
MALPRPRLLGTVFGRRPILRTGGFESPWTIRDGVGVASPASNKYYHSRIFGKVGWSDEEIGGPCERKWVGSVIGSVTYQVGGGGRKLEIGVVRGKDGGTGVAR